MKQKFYFLLLILLTGCFTETYNKIPCSHDFGNLHEKVNEFGLWSYGESPDGYIWKGKYDSTKVDCSTWTISLRVDSCDKIFSDEKFVTELADIVFMEPKNKGIQNINFEFGECDFQKGQRKYFYSISREVDSNLELGKLTEFKSAQIIEKISEGYSDQPENKIITLLLDSIPTNPYLIASEFANRNEEYRQIELIVENTNSTLCKRVEYLYGFDEK